MTDKTGSARISRETATVFVRPVSGWERRVGEEVRRGSDIAPAGALEHDPDGVAESGVSVGHHELETRQAPVFEPAKELVPERVVLGVVDVDAEDFEPSTRW
jgi:hypothetical protein